MEPKTAVAVSGFNRPYYFLPTLRSILGNAAIAKCHLWLFLDGGEGNEQALQVQIAREELAQAAYLPARFEVVLRPTNFGCGRNLIDLRRRLFDVENYDRAFIFEDDMVVSPDYLQICEHLWEWAAERYDDVGVVQAYNECWLSPEEKACRLDEVRAANSHWWGYLMPRRTWLAIRQHLYAYEDRFLAGRTYARRDIHQIRTWSNFLIQRWEDDGDVPSCRADGARAFPGAWDFRAYFARNYSCGQDAMTALALALAGYKKIVTTVNRGLPIGRRGIHSTDAAFAKRRLDQVKIDTFESDRYRRRFHPYDASRRPLKAYMRGDEVEAIRSLIRRRQPRRVLEFGGGGSTLVLSREEAVERWWTVETNDVWLRQILASMTDADTRRITVLSFGDEDYFARVDRLLRELEFDMIFVDGGNRGRLLERLHRYLQSRPAFVLLHDYARPAYAEAIGRFARRTELSAPRRDHQGLLLLEA